MNELERLADGGEHAEPEDVDFEKAEGIDVVFVPRHDRAPRHLGRLDGRNFVEWAGGKHESAHVRGHVPGEPLQLSGNFHDELDAAIARIEPYFAEAPPEREVESVV